MTPKLAREIFDIISDSCEIELYMDVIQKAVVYAHIRAEWALSDEATQAARRAERTIAHNAFIAATQKLALAMSEGDENATWRDNIGNDRQESAELACWIHYHLSMEAE